MSIRPVLTPYIPVADMLVQTYGPTCEVVLHDLSDPQHSVVYVANGTVTDRRVGQSFDQLVKQVILSSSLKDNFVANYYFTAGNGKRIRSSTLLIRGENGGLEGALCINIDMEPVYRQMELLNLYLPESPSKAEQPAREPEQHVAQMVTALIDNIIGSSVIDAMSREERVEKVRFMDAKGIFLMKGSVEQVAQKLGINKVTVYSYLDEIRKK